MVDVNVLVSTIKTFVHDLTLTNEIVYQAVDNAIRDIENYGTFEYQIITENATVLAGNKEINTTKDVFRVIEIDGLNSDAYYVQNNRIYLKETATANKTYNVKYVMKSPRFDGSQASLFVPNFTLLLYGGAFYASVFLNSPEAPLFNQFFLKELAKYYNETYFNENTDDTYWFAYNDVFNV